MMVAKPIESLFRIFALPGDAEDGEEGPSMESSLADLQEGVLPLLREEFVPRGNAGPMKPGQPTLHRAPPSTVDTEHMDVSCDSRLSKSSCASAPDVAPPIVAAGIFYIQSLAPAEDGEEEEYDDWEEPPEPTNRNRR